ncbi:MAG: 3-phosphoshikimate 1-carboxyvinyltransferase [Spirochaetes bacterium]|nr:3-phosphoshikimate 1-carboxyvinyltransferase [Spirochaetota bacterium]
MDREVSGVRRVEGEIRVGGDKSISHRALVLSSMADGQSVVRGLSAARDVASTLQSLGRLGVELECGGTTVRVLGKGIAGLKLPDTGEPVVLDCGNSGTTARLMTGLLAGAGVRARLVGDRSLLSRPMKRVIDPLCRFGARIEHREGRLPLVIQKGSLQAIRYTVPVPSAQVKTALILASMFVGGKSEIEETIITRDHTERLLAAMHAAFRSEPHENGARITVWGRKDPHPLDMEVPGDISSAVFFIALALIVPGSRLVVRNVGLNPTRARILSVFKRMGGEVDTNVEAGGPEPYGTVRVRGSSLVGTEVSGREIPLVIDEIPALACAALFASGETVIRDARELRVKESDRIEAVCDMVRRFGGEVEEREDGFTVRGGAPINNALIESGGDHRIAMAASVLACAAPGTSTIRGAECVSVSCPEFFDLLEHVVQ